jgi:hypothetical protein
MYRFNVTQWVTRRYVAHLLAGVLISISIVILALGNALMQSQAFL